MSNNHRPRFTDQELMTVYLFGHLRSHFTQRRIYDYAAGHWRGWFPDLPSYQAFNRHLDRAGAAFALLLQDALAQAARQLGGGPDRLLDSLPVMLARGSRGDAAKVARGLAAKGYCASKRLGNGSNAREGVDSLAWSNSSATTAAATDSRATA